MNLEYKKYLKKLKLEKFIILFFQIFILISFIISWELLSKYKIINPFIFSSPTKIIETIKNLFINYNLTSHILTTLYETLIAFVLGITLSFISSIILYEFKILNKIMDPYLTMLNSLPKVALGPLIIIIVGANTKSIIVMALLINLIVGIITIYNGFNNIEPDLIKLFKTFNASKKDILFKLTIPATYKTIISSLKLNISMTLIGVIMGEFLVSKAGIGYLIIYGTQIFNLNMVMSGIVILIIISFILYKIITYIENKLIK
ncbi:MAG: ABC transporter permease [Firmicutes bacterium]|nr:ABC transporter permease [Bacillota bacterium]